jgi:arsenate reductase
MTTDAGGVTLWHNPACGTSRNTLAIIQASGVTPTIIEYLETGWDRATLERLIAAIGQGARGLLRDKGTPAADLGLLDPDLADDAIVTAMIAHPILVNRPIVETPKGTRLCRPSEVVFDLLETPPASFTKEDGEVVRP